MGKRKRPPEAHGGSPQTPGKAARPPLAPRSPNIAVRLGASPLADQPCAAVAVAALQPQPQPLARVRSKERKRKHRDPGGSRSTDTRGPVAVLADDQTAGVVAVKVRAHAKSSCSVHPRPSAHHARPPAGCGLRAGACCCRRCSEEEEAEEATKAPTERARKAAETADASSMCSGGGILVALLASLLALPVGGEAPALELLEQLRRQCASCSTAASARAGGIRRPSGRWPARPATLVPWRVGVVPARRISERYAFRRPNELYPTHEAPGRRGGCPGSGALGLVPVRVKSKMLQKCSN